MEIEPTDERDPSEELNSISEVFLADPDKVHLRYLPDAQCLSRDLFKR